MCRRQVETSGSGFLSGVTEMEYLDDLEFAVRCLLDERFGAEEASRIFSEAAGDEDALFTLYRNLVNVREPVEASENFLAAQDAMLAKAARRYGQFRETHEIGKVLYLELGVDNNTPVIIKYPFWEAVARNPQAAYACVNMGEAMAPTTIADRSILIDADINEVLRGCLDQH